MADSTHPHARTGFRVSLRLKLQKRLLATNVSDVGYLNIPDTRFLAWL